MDTILQAALIGVLQGLTEFLPISSSAHLILVPRFLGWDDPFLNSAAFDVMLHVGTLVALLAYFRTYLLRLLRAGAASLRDRSLAGDPERPLAIGAAQALALFPGISRSGITIAAGLFLGLERPAAARFSFLMATPVIAGAGLWKARSLLPSLLLLVDP